MNYVGIDHQRQYSHMTVMDQMGQVLRSGRIPNLQNEIGKFVEGFEAVEIANLARFADSFCFACGLSPDLAWTLKPVWRQPRIFCKRGSPISFFRRSREKTSSMGKYKNLT